MRMPRPDKWLWKVFWWTFYYGFARHLPVSYRFGGRFGSFCRRMAARAIFKRCGRNVNVEHGAYIEQPWQLEIGDNSGLGVHALLDGPIRIGENVMMGREVIIYRRNHKVDRTDIPMREQGFEPWVPLVVEDDVWFGARVMVLPSCTRIGTGSVLAAGAVVVKDVPPFSVVGGNPARVIKNRADASAEAPPSSKPEASDP